MRWGESMIDGMRGNPPDQSNIYSSSLGLTNSSKNIFMQSLKDRQNKRHLLADINNVRYLNPMVNGACYHSSE